MDIRRLFAIAAASWLVLVSSVAWAQSRDPNCSASHPDGFKVDNEHSGWQSDSPTYQSFLCNLISNDAGTAVTIEYQCDAEAEAAWQSKTSSRRETTERRAEVSRSSDELIIRERGSFTGYAGTFPLTEKMFLRIDRRTIATVYVMSKRKAEGKEEPKDIRSDEPKVSAEQIASYARARANANAPFTGKMQCPGLAEPAPPNVPQAPRPPALPLPVPPPPATVPRNPPVPPNAPPPTVQPTAAPPPPPAVTRGPPAPPVAPPQAPRPPAPSTRAGGDGWLGLDYPVLAAAMATGIGAAAVLSMLLGRMKKKL